MEILLIIPLILFYLLPTLIAHYRKHHNRAAILLANLFFGWMGLGWVLTLIWSATEVKQ